MKKNEKERKISIYELVIFALLGALMYCSKLIMEAFPNIHLLGMFTMVFTLVYRKKALFPIYIYVMLNGLFSGFAPWWIPYLYIWTILWGITMLLPKKMPVKAAVPVYMLVCGLHGLAFGILYAPAQAIMFGLSFKAMIAWIIAGFPFDLIHGISNFFMGTLILPCMYLLKRLNRTFHY